MPLIEVLAIDLAMIRGRNRIDIVDAVHLAKARCTACLHCHDGERLRPTACLEVVQLADLVA